MDPHDISILVADDDDNIRLIVEGYLRKLGYATTAVADGAQAVGKFARLSFDICVLDIHMPHIDGIELVDAIRAIKPDCRILFITGEANEAEIRRVYEEKIGIAVLRKPFKLDSLRRYVEMLAASIDIRRKEEHLEERHRAYVENLPPARRLALRAGGLLRRLHETYVLYVVIAALVAAFSLLTAYDHVLAVSIRSEKTITQMYENMMGLLERWEKEDTRRDGR